MNKKIALVVLTYNRSILLKELLNSVLEQTLKPDHLFIIDNDSTDDTPAVVNSFITENQHIIPMSYHNTGDNLGGAGGFEYGSRLAYSEGYEWIWLADDDVQLESDCLSNLIEHCHVADILQPVRMNLDGTCAEISALDYDIDNITKLNPKYKTIVDVFEQQWETLPIYTIPFEGPLINRRVFEKIGFPNPDFFICSDDLDFAVRATRNDLKMACVKSARMLRKIKFIPVMTLSNWKGYFMYRNFFKVQLEYAKKPIGLVRCTLIYLSVSAYCIIKGEAKSLPVLFCAFKDAMTKGFPLDTRFKP